MCGLICSYSKKKKHNGKRVYELMMNQKTRGMQGFGYIAIKDNKIVSVVRHTEHAGIKDALMKEESELILFHHRLPTSTMNTKRTAHPIFVSNDLLKYDYYVAHNGIISNAEALKKIHEELGYQYTTESREKKFVVYADGSNELLSDISGGFNDSESLAIELAQFLEGVKETIDTRGSVAFWAAKVIKGTSLVESISFGKNMGRSLKVFDNKRWWGITSETGKDLKDMTLYTVGLTKLGLTESPLPIDKDEAPSSRFGYSWHRGDYDDPPLHTATLLPAPKTEPESKNYTLIEIYQSGLNVDDFDPIYMGAVKYYIPKKYKREDDTELELARNECERLATSYADQVSALEELEAEYEDGQFDSETYQQKQKELSGIKSRLEEEMWELDLPDNEIDEIVDLAMQLKDYNKSYNLS